MPNATPAPRVGLIGVGANLGDRRAAIEGAEAALRRAGLEVTAVSSIVSSRPVGGPPGQADYLNAVFRFESNAPPLQLLERLLVTENDLGRSRSPGATRWQARPIDLDLLLYGEIVLNTTQLRLPHPLLPLRPFVLRPACDVAPEMVHPVAGRTLRELARRLDRSSRWLWVAPETLRRHGAVLRDLALALDAHAPGDPWTIAPSPPQPHDDRSAPPAPRAGLLPGLACEIHAAAWMSHPEFGPIPALPLPGGDRMVNEQIMAVIGGTELAVDVLSPARVPDS